MCVGLFLCFLGIQLKRLYRRDSLVALMHDCILAGCSLALCEVSGVGFVPAAPLNVVLLLVFSSTHTLHHILCATCNIATVITV